MSIVVPEEFKKLCRNLGQDLDLVVSSAEELIQVALIGVELHERPAIKAFIDQLLDGRYSDEQLKDIWWSMPADLVFHEGKGVVVFLSMLRDAVSRAQ